VTQPDVADARAAAAALTGSFTVERSFDPPPELVYAAYADATVRRRWFRIPGSPADARHELDFRVGGGERSSGSFAPLGRAEFIEYRSVFLDITAGARIVFGYTLALDGVRRWASLVTVELSPRLEWTVPDGTMASGTLLRHTEQYSFLTCTGDGAGDIAHLKGSTGLALNGLAAALAP
jgi:uncharacterized protein YndB with AHSA1/START domain